MATPIYVAASSCSLEVANALLARRRGRCSPAAARPPLRSPRPSMLARHSRSPSAEVAVAAARPPPRPPLARRQGC
ncbi:hypothetical protein E2562_003865 [Oryza meyeriana var. granulata]|uniref:Uncharacterized protein n=1 Tax=Oryza meyeriana var. granulata TaxID=110450 RepID=A0A6G1CZE1_9ORYZ|nr:hypothetical protein E2562_003865 [Oryza meyeriana var. granulata]